MSLEDGLHSEKGMHDSDEDQSSGGEYELSDWLQKNLKYNRVIRKLKVE